MLKKRFVAGIMAVLSLFILTADASALSFGTKKTAAKAEEVAVPRIKMYMPAAKMEPLGGVRTRISASKGVSNAEMLYDGDTSKNFACDSDAEVTLDMGISVLLSQIRYYAGKIDKNGGNNCLGTRFFASADNKKYNELAVIENDTAPEDGWYEINFSGFGEYRYFRVELPEKSNISEIEWIGANGFSRTKQSSGRYDIKFSFCAYDAEEDIDASVLVAAYNKDGVMKQAAVAEHKFASGTATNFDAELKDAEVSDGDSYRVVMFEKDGRSSLKNPLNYRVNGAASEFAVSKVFSDNMVLQADKPAVVWGKAPRYRDIEVVVENSHGGSVKRTTQADENSDWSVNLGSFSAGGIYTMKIKADGVTYEYGNITFGDVWLCTGQSNMEYYMAACEDTLADLKKPEIKNDNIRLYNLFNKGMDGAAKPLDNPPVSGGSWQMMDADAAAYCSAVGYYFAQDIQRTINEPVGIISVAVGDTEINRWIAKDTKCGRFTSTDGGLYNNRIRPFEKLAIKGIILYQGEADQYRTHLSAETYSDAMAGLVDNYRKVWGADLPFYWTQLTRYRVDETLVREGQRLALGKVSEKKNIGMLSLLDIIGNYDAKTGSCRNDIHPWDKKTVAERFAAYAKRDCYGSDNAVSGPVYKSSAQEGNKLVLTFECNGSLSVLPKERYADKETDNRIKREKIDTSKPMEFEIAGSDGRFCAAEARLEGNKVILASNDVKEPVYARYAWGAYPEMPNLTDDTGLPAATFTTEKLD